MPSMIWLSVLHHFRYLLVVVEHGHTPLGLNETLCSRDRVNLFHIFLAQVDILEVAFNPRRSYTVCEQIDEK